MIFGSYLRLLEDQQNFGGISLGQVENTKALGSIIYTNYAIQFLLTGLIFLVTIIGTVFLIYRMRKKNVKGQDVHDQICGESVLSTGSKVSEQEQSL